MAFDNVGVALADDPHQLFEHRAFVHLAPGQHALITARIRQCDRDDAIALARGGGKLETRADVSLDIELEPAQIAELKPHEIRRPRQHKVLFDRIGQYQVRRVASARRLTRNLAQMAPHRVEPIGAVKAEQVAETEVAREFGRLMSHPQSLQQFAIRYQCKKLERPALPLQFAAVSPEYFDLVPRRYFDRNHSAVVRIAEEQTVPVELAADLFVAVHLMATRVDSHRFGPRSQTAQLLKRIRAHRVRR